MASASQAPPLSSSESVMGPATEKTIPSTNEISTSPSKASANGSSSSSVTLDRKRSLLLEARRARVEWVDEHSSPTRQSQRNFAAESEVSLGDEDVDGMVLLRQTRAVRAVPTAVAIVEALYASSSNSGFVVPGSAVVDIGERVRLQLESQVSSADIRQATVPPRSIRPISKDETNTLSTFSSEEAKHSEKTETNNAKVDADTQSSSSMKTTSKNNFLLFQSSYRIFIQRLRSPESADLVQTIRNFVQSFEDMAEAARSSKIMRMKEKIRSRKNDHSRASGSKDGNEDRNEQDTNDDDYDEAKQLALALRTFVQSTMETIRHHPIWSSTNTKKKEENDNNDETDTESDKDETIDQLKDYSWIQVAVETFVYAKCRDAIRSILLVGETGDAGDEDRQMNEQIMALQFVTPEHLDLDCLSFSAEKQKLTTEKEISSSENGEKNLEVDDSAQKDNEFEEDTCSCNDLLLQSPISSLCAVDEEYSPNRMLSRILDAYRGVSDVLAAAMQDQKRQQNEDSKNDTAAVVLPSADDVLPALIFTVLRAKPTNIASNLKFVQTFATESQLRGEAGYALANTCGAVQFLKDLDLSGGTDDKNRKKRVSKLLTITSEEFLAGVERCRSQMALPGSGKPHHTKSEGMNPDTPAKEKDDDTVMMNGNAVEDAAGTSNDDDSISDIITPLAVRQARLRGEIVDLSWVERWRNQPQAKQMAMCSEYASHSSRKDGSQFPQLPASRAQPASLNNHHSNTPPPPPLPPGFTRSYTYLSSDPNDIRMSDIPRLLREYRVLVRTVESLLTERTANYNAEHRRRVQLARDELESNAARAEEQQGRNKRDRGINGVRK